MTNESKYTNVHRSGIYEGIVDSKIYFTGGKLEMSIYFDKELAELEEVGDKEILEQLYDKEQAKKFLDRLNSLRSQYDSILEKYDNLIVDMKHALPHWNKEEDIVDY